MKMKKFRKRPIVIEAFQWNGEPSKVVLPYYEIDSKGNWVPTNNGQINTLEGTMIVTPGDWIITGVNGERYPCKPDIFEKTYEPVE